MERHRTTPTARRIRGLLSKRILEPSTLLLALLPCCAAPSSNLYGQRVQDPVTRVEDLKDLANRAQGAYAAIFDHIEANEAAEAEASATEVIKIAEQLAGKGEKEIADYLKANAYGMRAALRWFDLRRRAALVDYSQAVDHGRDLETSVGWRTKRILLFMELGEMHAADNSASVAIMEAYDRGWISKNSTVADGLEPEMEASVLALMAVARRTNGLLRMHKDILRRLDLRDFAGAQEKIESMLTTTTEDFALPWHEGLLANCYHKQEMYLAAKETMQPVMEQLVHSAWVFQSYGATLLALGETEEALLHFDRALELDPEDALAWTGLAEAKLVLGHTEEAHEAIRRAESEARGDAELERMIRERRERIGL